MLKNINQIEHMYLCDIVNMGVNNYKGIEKLPEN